MKLLLIEDDFDAARNILAEVPATYSADVAYSGSEGARLSQTNDYDVVLMDTTLSDSNELEVCKRVRSENREAAIVLLSGENDVSYKVKCLDAGADDYLAKPVNYAELSAKLRAITRRKRGEHCTCNSATYSGLTIDFENQEVTVRKEPVALRKREYDILAYLAINKGKVVSREKLLRYVWRDDTFIFSNTVDVHIKHLRDKLERPFGEKFIRTVRGFGYKFDVR